MRYLHTTQKFIEIFLSYFEDYAQANVTLAG